MVLEIEILMFFNTNTLMLPENKTEKLTKMIIFHYLTFGRFTKVPPFHNDRKSQHLYQIKGGPYIYFVTWCASIGTKGWYRENSL